MPSQERRTAGRRRVTLRPADARAHNTALVLRGLVHDGPLSRADLARATGLTRVTISDLVADLVGRGLVVEQGARPASGPGKPAILVDVHRAGHQVIGLDLSASGAFTGIVSDLAGAEIARREVPRPADGDAQAAIRSALDLAADLAAAATAPLLGVGVGAPGVIGPDGVVLTSPNLGWRDVPLSDLVAERTGVRAIVANDANAAAVAERTLGSAGSDVLVIRMGRGFGAGLLSGGEPVLGTHFAAGEIGHVVVGTDDGPPCACGKRGCLEAWVSARTLSDRIARGDDRQAVIDEAGQRLGIALAPLVATLDLPEIVIVGPADLFGDAFIDRALATIRARTLAGVHDDIRMTLSAHGEDIVLRGAVATVMRETLGVA